MNALPISYMNLLMIHAASTLLMVGVIWLIQLVHYPLFALVGEHGYQQYQAQHMKRITWLVGPLMVLEAGTALLLFHTACTRHVQPAFIGLILLGLIWCSTLALQVPAHSRLMERWDGEAHRRLVCSNWIRTFAWTARGGVALSLFQ